ncbi:MAG: hypothetical protein WCI73_15855, partial [Phycisphaerae bacterium]
VAQKTGTSQGRTFQVAEGVRIESDMPTDKGTQVIHFYPNGRTEPATIRVMGDKQVLEIVCLSAAEGFHIAAAKGGA